MNPVLLLLLALFSLSSAQSSTQPLFSWAGTTIGSTTWEVPTYTLSSAACSISTRASYYVAMNTTFSATKVYNLLAMSDKNAGFLNYNVFVYQGSFNPASPCSNLITVMQKTQDYDNGPQVDDYFLFQAGTPYFFILSGQASNYYGRFVVQIFDTAAWGTNTASPTYNPPHLAADGTTCVADATYGPAAYVSYTFTVPKAGFYDIIAGFQYNASSIIGNDGTILVLYTGGLPTTLKTATSTCNGVFFLATATAAGTESDGNGNYLFGMDLAASTTYTAVFSAKDANMYSNYAFQVIPSRLVKVDTGFRGPTVNLYTTNCSVNTDNNDNFTWYAFTYTAPYSMLFIETSDLGSEAASQQSMLDVDTQCTTYIYTGTNVGSAGSPPPGCPDTSVALFRLVQNTGNDGAPLIYGTTPGTLYSIVVASEDPVSAEFQPAAIIWVMTGVPVGGNGVLNTTIFTTGTISTAAAGSTTAAAVSQTTTGGVVVGSGGIPGSTGNTILVHTGTGGAGTLAVSFVMIAVMLFIALN